MCRQRAGCNAWAAKAGEAGGRRRVLRVLRAWRLANGRLECAMCRQRRVLAILGVQRAWLKLPRSVLGVLRVWRLANGRLECPNKRGLCAGKGQAAMLERWRPGAWWKLPRGMCTAKRQACNPGAAKARRVLEGFKGLKAGKRQARMATGLGWQLPRSVLGVLRVWGWQTAGSNALTREGYVQVKGKCWSADGRLAMGFRGFKGLKAGKRQARMP